MSEEEETPKKPTRWVYRFTCKSRTTWPSSRSAYTKEKTKFQNVLKKLWVLCMHVILMLPSSIFRIVVGALDFYQLYNSILEHFEFYVQYSHSLDLKSFLCLYLNQMLINNMVRIMYIVF
jgi:hypothetical protein